MTSPIEAARLRRENKAHGTSGYSASTLDRVDRLVMLSSCTECDEGVRTAAAAGLESIANGAKVNSTLEGVLDIQRLLKYPALVNVPTVTARRNLAAHLDTLSPEERDERTEELVMSWVQAKELYDLHTSATDELARVKSGIKAAHIGVLSVSQLNRRHALASDLRRSWAEAADLMTEFAENIREALK